MLFILFFFYFNEQNVEIANNKLSQIQEKPNKFQDDDYYNNMMGNKKNFADNLYEYPVPKEPLKGVKNKKFLIN